MNWIILFLKNIELKYYLVFGLGYLAGWFLTQKIFIFIILIIAILCYSSFIHRNSQS